MAPGKRLQRHIRFARSLALVSGATIGIAAGVALVVPTGCESCNGICGYVPPPANADGGGKDSGAADTATDAEAGPDGGAGGGGPLAAPPLPATWIG
jgi:hypothetical protein